jgi:N-acyl-D-aspartate/D-glutamate deacylase
VILTASKLRSDIYRILDLVLETGEAVEIERNGRRLRITADEPPTRLGRLISRPDAVVGDSDDFVHLDWSGDWSNDWSGDWPNDWPGQRSAGSTT